MQPNTRDASHAQLMGAVTLLLAPIVTIMVCDAIVGRWETLHWLDKGMAGVLVLSIVMIPLVAVFRERTWGKRLEAVGAQDTYLAYTWLMLATLLFNHF